MAIIRQNDFSTPKRPGTGHCHYQIKIHLCSKFTQYFISFIQFVCQNWSRYLLTTTKGRHKLNSLKNLRQESRCITWLKLQNWISIIIDFTHID